MDKAVLVTGASTGIGRACAETLARAGFIVFAGVRKAEDAKALEDLGLGLRPLFLDVTKDEHIKQAVLDVKKALGSTIFLVGLVNNAGIVVAAPMEFVPLEQLRWQFEVNVIGQIAVTQAFLPMLRREEPAEAPGRVVMMSSSSGFFAAPFLGPYAASKYALEAVTDSLRRELCSWSIPISLVEPGTIETPIWDKSEQVSDDILDKLPPIAKQLYGWMVPRVKAVIESNSGSASPPSVVSDAVLHALTARKPKKRYPVGKGAALQIRLLPNIPVSLVDKIVTRAMGIDRK